MKIAMWDLAKVTPYHRNPRHNDGAVEGVARSIEAFGFRQPIVVDEAGVIIVGHTRLKAAQQLGLARVPVHVALDLSPEQVAAYRLADNRTNEDATWDEELLAGEMLALQELGFDLSLTGFDAEQIAELVGGGAVTPEAADAAEVPPLPAVPITQPGDRILLGRHVLVCGDAKSPNDWRSLMDGTLADAVWTDPPYGVSYGKKNARINASEKRSGTGKAARIETAIEGDEFTADGLREFLRETLGHTLSACRPGAAWYVSAPPGPLHFEFAGVLLDLEVWRHTLQWVKNGMVLGRSDYHYRHEPIFYGWKPGASHTWHGDRSQTTVLEFDRPRSNDLHPTMKPVALIAYCLGNSVQPGDVVLDPFAGSGSTLIACETAGTAARCLEVSPAYCDVIVQRWEEATGEKAKRPKRAAPAKPAPIKKRAPTK